MEALCERLNAWEIRCGYKLCMCVVDGAQNERTWGFGRRHKRSLTWTYCSWALGGVYCRRHRQITTLNTANTLFIRVLKLDIENAKRYWTNTPYRLWRCAIKHVLNNVFFALFTPSARAHTHLTNVRPPPGQRKTTHHIYVCMCVLCVWVVLGETKNIKTNSKLQVGCK